MASTLCRMKTSARCAKARRSEGRSQIAKTIRHIGAQRSDKLRSMNVMVLNDDNLTDNQIEN